MAAAVSIIDVVKNFGALRALDGVSLEIGEGEFFGLLGPNGAGKTTLISTLAGLVRADSGRLSVLGHDVVKDYRKARSLLGVVPQELVFDPFFTPFEVLENQAGLYGVRKELRRSMDLLRAVHLEDKARAYARTLSGGM